MPHISVRKYIFFHQSWPIPHILWVHTLLTMANLINWSNLKRSTTLTIHNMNIKECSRSTSGSALFVLQWLFMKSRLGFAGWMVWTAKANYGQVSISHRAHSTQLTLLATAAAAQTRTSLSAELVPFSTVHCTTQLWFPSSKCDGDLIILLGLTWRVAMAPTGIGMGTSLSKARM